MTSMPQSAPARRLRATKPALMAIAIGAMVALAGCSDDKGPVYEEKPVSELYNSAFDLLSAGNYEAAAKEFEEVERQHPFSVWAPRAQLMGAYAHYEADAYDDAVIAADRFIQLHPNNIDAPYAFYLKALAYYEQIVDVQRDQHITAQAMAALDEVRQRYPDTVYARDAQLKRDLAFDHLAGKDMAIGRYYMEAGKPIAAINRFRRVLRDFQTTSHVPEALHRLVEAYTALGLSEEAKRTAAVLGHNFPGSAWYSDSYYLLTGTRVEVAINVDDRGAAERYFDYLFVPGHTIGSVDPDAEPEGKEALAGALDQVGPTVATLGDPPTPAAKTQAKDQAAAASAQAKPVVSPAAAPVQLQASLAAADQQKLTAEQASAGWREEAAKATSESARQRAVAQAEIAQRAEQYWAARGNLLRLAIAGETDPEKRRTGERAVAETALTYWQAVERLGETATERQVAGQNAADAEKALAYWSSEGRGWLLRLFGGRA